MAATSTFSSWQRAEPWLLMAVAFVLRALWIDYVSVEHFDEGVYASGYFSEHLDHQYPDQHLYAPPLFPYILKSVLFYSGGNPHSVAWVNVVFGTLLVGAVWLVTKDWFGQPAAFVAGTLLATNEFAIHFSRAILTDTPLCLWLTLGVWAGWKSITQGGVRWILAAGVLAALAWWTKYNGWLTLAITGAGTMGAIVFERHGRKESRTMLLRWLATAFIASLLWSPCVWSLQPVGGYAAVAANHAGYFGGFGGWWEAAIRHFNVERYHDSISGQGVGVLGFALALAIAFTKRIHTFVWYLMLTLATAHSMQSGLLPMLVMSMVGAVYIILVLISVATVSIHQLRRQLQHADPYLVPSIEVLPGNNDEADRPADACAAIEFFNPGDRTFNWQLTTQTVWPAMAWATGLAFATPLYKPYPRLFLPCLTGLVVFSVSMTPYFKNRGRKYLTRCSLMASSVLAVTSLILLAGFHLPAISESRTSSAWQSRIAFAQIAEQSVAEITGTLRNLPPSSFDEADCVVYVLGEPGLYYYIAAARGRDGANHLAQPASNLGMLAPVASVATSRGLPAFLVTGLHAHRDHPELLINPPAGLKLLAEYPYIPSDLVLLDDMPPKDLPAHRRQVVRLWQIP